MLIHSAILNILQEIEHIWLKRFSLPTLLYIFTRYASLVSGIMNVFGPRLFDSMGDVEVLVSLKILCERDITINDIKKNSNSCGITAYTFDFFFLLAWIGAQGQHSVVPWVNANRYRFNVCAGVRLMQRWKGHNDGSSPGFLFRAYSISSW